MLLSNKAILEGIRQKRIKFNPGLNEADFGPVGVRVHLGNNIMIPKANQDIDFGAAVEPDYNSYDLTDCEYNLRPGEFILASTVEQIMTDASLMPFLDGRSTLARLGLTIHNSAFLLDGRSGEWMRPVLEIKNHGPFNLKLKAGLPIGMVSFFQVVGAIIEPQKDSRYAKNSNRITPLI